MNTHTDRPRSTLQARRGGLAAAFVVVALGAGCGTGGASGSRPGAAVAPSSSTSTQPAPDPLPPSELDRIDAELADLDAQLSTITLVTSEGDLP